MTDTPIPSNILRCKCGKPEEWRPAVGFDGRYMISSHGRVYSVFRGSHWTGRILKAALDKKGYLRVSLDKKTRKVHHLVLDAFVRARSEGEQCAHLDGVSTNNHFSNLAWKTAYENAQDKLKHGTRLMGEKTGAAKLTDANVMDIRRLRKSGLKWTEIHARFDFVRRHTVINAGNGVTYAHLNGPDHTFSAHSIKLRKTRANNRLSTSGRREAGS